MIQVIWEPISRDIRNEPLDLRVYNLACLKSLLPHINWVQLADMLGVAVPEEVRKKPKAAQAKPKAARKKSRSTNLY